MYRRNLSGRVLEALEDTPAVFLHGPRQSGKTTLVRQLAMGPAPARYLSLDEPPVLAAAASDPAGFVSGLETPVVLDEVQRVPELFLALKAEIDRDRRPGRFLLTGSAHAMAVPQVAEALVGRVEMAVLRPLSQGEVGGVQEGFVDALFAREWPSLAESDEGPALRERVLSGGYPEILSRVEARRGAWFESYLDLLVQRDVRQLLNVEDTAAMVQVISALATRAGNLLAYSDLAGVAEIPVTTLKRYFGLLEATFLLERLPAWASNLGKRLARKPKVHFTDTGLLAHVLGLDAARLAEQPQLFGALLENFVVAEVAKQLGWSRTRCRMYHYRTRPGREVDLVLEEPGGRVAAIEVKSGATVTGGDFRGLRELEGLLGERFVRGVVLYGGKDDVPFGANLRALPISALWRLGTREQERPTATESASEDDLLGLVERMLRRREGSAVKIERLAAAGAAPPYLNVSVVEEDGVRLHPVGVVAGELDAATLDAFLAVHRRYRKVDPAVVSLLLCGVVPAAELLHRAAAEHLRVQSLADFLGHDRGWPESFRQACGDMPEGLERPPQERQDREGLDG